MQGHTKTKMALLALSLLSLTVSSVLSARIVGFMALGGSQYINMKHIMEELASRGHQVDKESVVLIFQNIHATHSSCKLNTAEGFIDTIS